MVQSPLEVLLVEDQPGDAFLIQQMLSGPNASPIHVSHVERLAHTLQYLQQQHVDIILLDLSLPDSHGIETLNTVQTNFASVPIVILTGLDDEQLALQAVHNGAQDYLIKGQVTTDLLLRAIYYAIERHRIDQALKHRTLALEQSNQALQTRTVQLEQANRDLLQRTGQLEAANVELDAFNYTVTHDLRNPLTVVKGFATLLETCYAHRLDEQGLQYIQHIQMTTSHMGELLQDLLDLSRTEASPMNFERVDLSAIAQDILLQFQQRNPDRRVKFKVTPNLMVHGDRHLLWVALDNLLSNAWKYTQTQKSPHIELETLSANALSPDIREQLFPSSEVSQDPEDISPLVYVVRDNGVGFDMEEADKLFRPFQRLHSKAEFEGTGIGLATVQRIIRRHNGNIWGQSQMNQGASFFFTLPPPPLLKANPPP